ncbi:MAG: DUF5104 domain-containing protein [Clostridia bacterium]|nr:DUF5104 domain-containing protein [Clostridia bacterium]
MLERIIAFIMSILMTIFPFFEEKKIVSNEEVAEAVIYAVENKDASAMEAVMCKNIKDNYDDLTGEINKMLSCIEGDIESISWKKFGGYYENDGNGNSVKQNDQDYIIITSKGIYGFSVVVETDNSFNPEELGIRAIALHTLTVNPNPNSSYGYLYGEFLYKISATEGIAELHD